MPRIAATDLAGSRNLQRAAVGGAKSIQRGEHVLHPFQLRRRHGGDGGTGVVDKRREDDPRLEKDGNGLCLMASVAYRRSVDTQSE